AETIKIAAILDLEFFDWLYERRNHLTDVSDHALYSEMICRACALKSGIVAADEREAGCRALLNYGHTFGHALEIAGDFSISHGEAVACGMTAAAAFAEAHGDLAHGEVVRQTELLTAAGLPTVSPRQFGAERLLELMGRDKKNSGGGINIVVPVGLGKGVVLRHADRAGLVEALEAINA
ncbi:MAG: 3-dehydroquinate synthase, partial [Victivallaceae bacterium]|nr:3-dehydroquinate synthase [Victivallaceae bacterium]